MTAFRKHVKIINKLKRDCETKLWNSLCKFFQVQSNELTPFELWLFKIVIHSKSREDFNSSKRRHPGGMIYCYVLTNVVKIKITLHGNN